MIVKTLQNYNDLYAESINDSNTFWSNVANRIDWHSKWNNVSKVDYDKAEIKWFIGGKLNASYNCLDRHIENGDGNRVALVWEGNDPLESKQFTYQELLDKVCQFSNALKSIGAKKGDRVCIYMQMVPELTIAMLALGLA